MQENSRNNLILVAWIYINLYVFLHGVIPLSCCYTSSQKRSATFVKGLHYQNFLNYSEVVLRRCSVKKVFLKISQNSRENTRGCGTGVFLWILWNFYEHLRWLLLTIAKWCEKNNWAQFFFQFKYLWESGTNGLPHLPWKKLNRGVCRTVSNI